jgi:hypothetical protein
MMMLTCHKSGYNNRYLLDISNNGDLGASVAGDEDLIYIWDQKKLDIKTAIKKSNKIE